MKTYLSAAKQLLKIGLIGLSLLTPPFGWLAIYYAAAGLFGSERGFFVWLNLDRTIASILYGFKDRTLSGIAGERAANKSKRWQLIAQVIDWVTREPCHCHKAWEKEAQNEPPTGGFL